MKRQNVFACLVAIFMVTGCNSDKKEMLDGAQEKLISELLDCRNEMAEKLNKFTEDVKNMKSEEETMYLANMADARMKCDAKATDRFGAVIQSLKASM